MSAYVTRRAAGVRYNFANREGAEQKAIRVELVIDFARSRPRFSCDILPANAGVLRLSFFLLVPDRVDPAERGANCCCLSRNRKKVDREIPSSFPQTKNPAKYAGPLKSARGSGLGRGWNAELVKGASQLLADCLCRIRFDDEALHEVDKLSIAKNGDSR